MPAIILGDILREMIKAIQEAIQWEEIPIPTQSTPIQVEEEITQHLLEPTMQTRKGGSRVHKEASQVPRETMEGELVGELQKVEATRIIQVHFLFRAITHQVVLLVLATVGDSTTLLLTTAATTIAAKTTVTMASRVKTTQKTLDYP